MGGISFSGIWLFTAGTRPPAPGRRFAALRLPMTFTTAPVSWRHLQQRLRQLDHRGAVKAAETGPEGGQPWARS